MILFEISLVLFRGEHFPNRKISQIWPNLKIVNFKLREILPLYGMLFDLRLTHVQSAVKFHLHYFNTDD